MVSGHTTPIVEIRLHGRGGQGAVVASTILATAAFLDGAYVQSFPTFGVERRGAPVAAFVRISRSPILIRCAVTEPHHVIVLDKNLIADPAVAEGLRPNGWVVVNAPSDHGIMPEHLRAMPCGVAIVNATDIAVRNKLGTRTAPIVNTAIVGAFARATALVSLESLIEAIGRLVPAHVDRNVTAAREAYRETVEVRPSRDLKEVEKIS